MKRIWTRSSQLLLLLTAGLLMLVMLLNKEPAQDVTLYQVIPVDICQTKTRQNTSIHDGYPQLTSVPVQKNIIWVNNKTSGSKPWQQAVADLVASLDNIRLSVRTSQSKDNTIPFQKRLTSSNFSVIHLRSNSSKFDFIQMGKHDGIHTLVLPWIKGAPQLPHTEVYPWTGDSHFCASLSDSNYLNIMYSIFYQNKCETNWWKTLTPQPMDTLYFFGEINPTTAKTSETSKMFHEHVPDYTTYIHVITHGVVTGNGNVYTRDLMFDLFTCEKTPGDDDIEDTTSLPVAEEVFIISQPHGGDYYHFMLEQITRLAPYINFLTKHTNIRIHVKKQNTYLNQTLEMLGLSSSRIISGHHKASLIYLPRATHCLTPWPFESQLLAKLYQPLVGHDLPRNLVVLIKRSKKKKRNFTKAAEIEELVNNIASQHGLQFYLFRDDPSPDLRTTMEMFHRAVAIVAPHGAGLSNIIYSQPGTFIMEGVCQQPWTILCFQWTSYILGHHYHGLGDRGGCSKKLDVDPSDVRQPLYEYLAYYNRLQNQLAKTQLCREKT